jgi:hypothetical protein
MIYTVLFLKIKDLSEFYMQSLARHPYLASASVQSIFFQFHHWLNIHKQLEFN